uniref:Uncharacterized protein n=1 Tax=Faxonius propinquus nudivirus TaxID=3139431 RepID=A0AAU8GCE1_9VIRU
MPAQDKLIATHLALLKLNNVEISSITPENIASILNRLTTKKKKKISENYKISILQTLQRVNNDLKVSPKQLKITGNRRSIKTLLPNFISNVINIIKYAYNFKPTLFLANNETTALIDTIIAILLITSTNIVIGAVYKLKLSELDLLVIAKTVTIQQFPTIIINPTLFANTEKKINALIKYRITSFTANKFSEKKKFSTHVISCNSDVINKKIKELNFLLNYKNTDIDDIHTFSLGLQSIRFIPKDILYEYLRTIL